MIQSPKFAELFFVAAALMLCVVCADATSCPTLDSLHDLSEADIRTPEKDKKGRLLHNIFCHHNDYQLTLNGNPVSPFVIKCIPKTGKWNPDVFKLNLKCERIRCSTAEIASNCKFVKSDDYYVGEEVRFELPEGHEFSNSKETILFGTCRLDSQRRPHINTSSGEIPQCRPKTASPRPKSCEGPSKPISSCHIQQIKNGNMYLSKKYLEKISEFPVSVPVGSKLFVKCELGFELTGKSSFKCRSKGRAGPPKCRRKKRTIGTNESEA